MFRRLRKISAPQQLSRKRTHERRFSLRNTYSLVHTWSARKEEKKIVGVFASPRLPPPPSPPALDLAESPHTILAMAAAPAARFPVFGLVRLLGLAAAAAIVVWAVHFRGGMALSSETDKLLIFNVIIMEYSREIPVSVYISLAPLARGSRADLGGVSVCVRE